MLEHEYRLNRVVGISVCIRPDELLHINICEISGTKSTLHIERKVSGLDDLRKIKNYLRPGVPIALNISGKGVLQKQVKLTDYDLHGGFDSLLPNIDRSHFYIQEFRSGGMIFFSLIRKTDTVKYISALNDLGFEVLTVSLGPFVAWQIVSQLNIYAGDLFFDGYEITRNEKEEWLHVNYGATTSYPFDWKIDNEPINENLIVAYASAFQLILADRLEPINADDKELKERLDHLLFIRKLKINAFILLVCCFILLLLNFAAFLFLDAENKRLEIQLSSSANATQNIEGLNAGVRVKEDILRNLGWDGHRNKSVIIDQIASLLPKGVIWENVTVNPLDLSASRNQKTLKYHDRMISVTGSAKQIIGLNEWVARMRQMPLVKKANLESYVFNPEMQTGQFIVKIEF